MIYKNHTYRKETQCQIELIIAINFISFKDTNAEWAVHSISDNIEVVTSIVMAYDYSNDLWQSRWNYCGTFWFASF